MLAADIPKRATGGTVTAIGIMSRLLSALVTAQARGLTQAQVKQVRFPMAVLPCPDRCGTVSRLTMPSLAICQRWLGHAVVQMTPFCAETASTPTACGASRCSASTTRCPQTQRTPGPMPRTCPTRQPPLRGLFRQPQAAQITRHHRWHVLPTFRRAIVAELPLSRGIRGCCTWSQKPLCSCTSTTPQILGRTTRPGPWVLPWVASP
mmetsp:Transcript_67384/g.156433  ORF Transcript_67384/g.156433 Transcript_67384/m.156433 type:complete len:207 (+) Transcript_67384:477-1097(+)